MQAHKDPQNLNFGYAASMGSKAEDWQAQSMWQLTAGYMQSLPHEQHCRVHSVLCPGYNGQKQKPASSAVEMALSLMYMLSTFF